MKTKKQPRITVTCEQCGTLFQARVSARKKGQARYCSKQCYQTAIKTCKPDARRFQPIPCANCGTIFTPYHPAQKYCTKKCFKQCQLKYNAKWKKESRQNYGSSFLWTKLNRLKLSNGKTIRVKKRPWTGYCELCGRNCKIPRQRTSWHHWDENHPEKGIWVCGKCHWAAEVFESMMLLLPKYIEIKQKIEHGRVE